MREKLRNNMHKRSAHVLSGWSVHSTFTYGDFLDPLQIYRGKDCVEKFVQQTEDEVNKLYAAFPQ